MIRQLAVRGFDKNFSYFVGDEKNILVIDPGDANYLIEEIEKNKYKLKGVLITHSHFDHVEGALDLIERYDVPIYMHKKAVARAPFKAEKAKFVDEGDVISIGDLNIKVLYTPGHIDDAVCYYIEEDHSEDGVPKIFTGDTLFVEACGHAYMESSNIEDLYKSLQRLKALPGETIVYPGHDYGSKPFSTIAFEKSHNKYFLCKDFEEFKKIRG